MVWTCQTAHVQIYSPQTKVAMQIEDVIMVQQSGCTNPGTQRDKNASVAPG